MDKKIDIDEMLKREWRQLGFYYDTDDQSKEWRIFGDKKGITNLAKILTDYCHKMENSQISEHIHLGPYSYLKIMTWNKPFVNTEVIAGTIEDLRKLSRLVLERLALANPGDTFSIDKEYSDENEAKIIVKVMNDNFNPVTMDEQLKA